MVNENSNRLETRAVVLGINAYHFISAVLCWNGSILALPILLIYFCCNQTKRNGLYLAFYTFLFVVTW